MLVSSKAHVENAILEREGFRVELELFDGKRPTLPLYDYPLWLRSDGKSQIGMRASPRTDYS